ncbi:MAG: hypothetical protein WEB60_12970 [Terrimicrobiaceae bacterium]
MGTRITPLWERTPTESMDVTVVSESTEAGLKTTTLRDSQPLGPSHPKRFIRLEVNLQ